MRKDEKRRKKIVKRKWYIAITDTECIFPPWDWDVFSRISRISLFFLVRSKPSLLMCICCETRHISLVRYDWTIARNTLAIFLSFAIKLSCLPFSFHADSRTRYFSFTQQNIQCLLSPYLSILAVDIFVYNLNCVFCLKFKDISCITSSWRYAGRNRRA